jgi:hypothetical protein
VNGSLVSGIALPASTLQPQHIIHDTTKQCALV